MLIESFGKSPTIDHSAVIAPSAVISGDVQIGPHTAVLAGAVITAEGAPVRVGTRCVIMEHAIIRGAGKFPCILGDHVLIGPHAYVSGATIHRQCFLATGATVFNAAVLEEGTWVAVQGVVHIATHCPPSTYIPISHIAVGDPATVYQPNDAPTASIAIAAVGFTKTVFGFDVGQIADPGTIREICERYTHALCRHLVDRIVEE